MTTLELNQKKVLETKKLLVDVIKNPNLFNKNKALAISLKSQTGLAKLTDTDRSITSCSLNTLKSASESILERGFVELDELRKNALKCLAINCKIKNKINSKEKISQLENQLVEMKKINFLYSTIIEELRNELKKMACSNETLENNLDIYRNCTKQLEAKLAYTLKGDI